MCRHIEKMVEYKGESIGAGGGGIESFVLPVIYLTSPFSSLMTFYIFRFLMRGTITPVSAAAAFKARKSIPERSTANSLLSRMGAFFSSLSACRLPVRPNFSRLS